jgi:hypothetical protein
VRHAPPSMLLRSVGLEAALSAMTARRCRRSPGARR